MKINIEKAKDEFIKYTEKYNLEDEDIKRKQQHSLRVMEISEYIAKDIKLDKEKIQLAKLIGLLHDIGRFQQYQSIGLGDNIKKFDHGDYGTKILFQDGLIRKFLETDEFDEIIKKAIRNHNKFQIEQGLTSEESLFVKLIRDADKIDILYLATNVYYKKIENQVEESVLSDNIYNQFNKRTTIKREQHEKIEFVDYIISTIAFIYDINYKISYKIIKEKDYIDKILERYNFKDKKTAERIEILKNEANKYVDMKIMEK